MTSTTFLDLPLELRQRVYLLYFQPGRIIDARFLREWVHHENSGAEFPHLKALLRVKELKDEATWPFFRSSIFDIMKLDRTDIARFQKLADHRNLQFGLLSCIHHATVVLKAATLNDCVGAACAALNRFPGIQTFIIDARDLLNGHRQIWCGPKSPLYRQLAQLSSLRHVTILWEFARYPSDLWEIKVQRLIGDAFDNLCIELVRAGKMDVVVEQRCIRLPWHVELAREIREGGQLETQVTQLQVREFRDQLKSFREESNV